MTNPIPPVNRSNTNQRQYSPIVTVNGARYRFTVFNDAGDVTGQYDWQNIAKEATKIALKLAGKKGIERASIVLTGLPANFNTGAPPARHVILDSATITDKAHAKAQEFSGDDIDPEIQPKINRSLRNIERNFKNLEAVPPAFQQPPSSHLTLNSVAGNGSCLDLSIVYQLIQARRGTDFRPLPDVLFNAANTLRTLAADKLRTDASLDNDINLLKLIVASIEAIPAFSDNNYSRIVSDSPGVSPLISESEFRIIQNLVHNYSPQEVDFNRMPQIDRQSLREFYANYIDQNHADGNKKNCLDIAFLYLVPKIHPAYKIAVVDDFAITSCYPEGEQLNFNDWMFIYLGHANTPGAHYSPVDKTSSQAILQEWIRIKNQRMLGHH